ncbi:hypothetical protein [Brevibacterium senegalense]|uniref:hypothetical protein n=1 Tax=Brevibacterium senegalense TaxID=1033736 RepID=UPI0003699ACB|nr:hypothetical protein [Brevibacterium senegalense]
MDFMRMRTMETELSVEETHTGRLQVVRRYRPAVLVREAVRGLVGGFVSVVVLTALAEVLGREWAIIVGGLAGCGWVLGAFVLVNVVRRGGPVSPVAVLPSRWTGVPAEAEPAVFRWAELEQLVQEDAAGDGVRGLQRRVESEVDRRIAEMLVSEVRS